MRQHLYLEIAQQHLSAMHTAFENSRPIFWSAAGGSEASSHIRDAIATVVFTAMAVELAVNERLAIEVYRGSASKEFRQAIFESRITRSLPFKAKLNLLSALIPDLGEHIDDAAKLSEIRNELVHGRFDYYVIPERFVPNLETLTIDHITEPLETISFPGMSSEYIQHAEHYVPLAELIIDLLSAVQEGGDDED